MTPQQTRRILAGVQAAGVFAALSADKTGGGRRVEIELKREPRNGAPLQFPTLSFAEMARVAACMRRLERLVLDEAIAASTRRNRGRVRWE